MAEVTDQRLDGVLTGVIASTGTIWLGYVLEKVHIIYIHIHMAVD